MVRKTLLGITLRQRPSEMETRKRSLHGTIRTARDGFSLLEVMIALAIITAVLGATAQALIRFHTQITFQHQRVSAMQNCRSVLDEMRALRDHSPDEFPENITESWTDGLALGDIGTLPSEVVTVTYQDASANPLEVRVTSEWRDPRNRLVSISLSTVITDE